MARNKPQGSSGSSGSQEPAESDVVLPADSAAAIYRDKSGKSLTGNLSEGAANFGAITAAARALVSDANDEPPEVEA